MDTIFTSSIDSGVHRGKVSDNRVTSGPETHLVAFDRGDALCASAWVTMGDWIDRVHGGDGRPQGRDVSPNTCSGSRAPPDNDQTRTGNMFIVGGQQKLDGS